MSVIAPDCFRTVRLQENTPVVCRFICQASEEGFGSFGVRLPASSELFPAPGRVLKALLFIVACKSGKMLYARDCFCVLEKPTAASLQGYILLYYFMVPEHSFMVCTLQTAGIEGCQFVKVCGILE